MSPQVSQRLIPAEKQRYGEGGRVVGLDAAARLLTMADGTEIQYNKVSPPHSSFPIPSYAMI